MIQTIIAKPTKDCNADCQYCSTPPDHEGGWSFEQFKTMFDRLHHMIADDAVWIWHGGEPMLLGPQFYIDTFEYAKKIKPNLQFAMQSNLLLYTTKKWKKVFEDIFNGSVSTSFDPDELNRTIKGSTKAYSKLFYKKIKLILEDGFRPLVIGTYTTETKEYGMKMYDKSLSYGDMAFSLRFNYRYPAGRDSGKGAAISPEDYGNMLIELYNRWIIDLPPFLITPLDQMFKKCYDKYSSTCPWTRSCGGKFVSIDPNGDVYNCGEFADLNDPNFKFGNLLEGTISSSKPVQVVNFYRKVKDDTKFANKMMSTYPARAMARRRTHLPGDCKTCRHFEECEGGCMRDSELFERGLGGKFFYCKSWKMVFDRIKETMLNGEADGALIKMGQDPKKVRESIISQAEDSGYLDFMKDFNGEY